MIKRQTVHIIAINILVLSAFTSPAILPLGLSIFSISKATWQVKRDGQLSSADNSIMHGFREIGRHFYMSAAFRNILQYDKNCFEINKKYWYLPKPMSECNQSNIEFDNVVRFGKYRDRLHSHTYNKTVPSKEKIIVVGDSHAMGWGVSDSEIFTYHLSREGVESINLSVSSYATAKELERIKDFKINNPDEYSKISTVVIQYNNGDYTENLEFLSKGNKDILNPSRQRLKDFQDAMGKTNIVHIPNNSSWFLPLIKPAIVRRTILSFYELARESIRDLPIVNSIISILRPSKDESPTAQPTHSEAFYGVLSKYREVLKGKRIIIFISNGWGLSNNSLSNEFVRDSSVYNAQTSEPSRRLTVIEPFKNSQEGLGYYYLDDHLNPLGHRIIATSIVDELAKSH